MPDYTVNPFDLGTTGAVLGVGPEDDFATKSNVAMIVLSSFAIQVMLLYYMNELCNGMKSRDAEPPLVLALLAVFLHLMNTCQPILMGLRLVKTLNMELDLEKEDEEDPEASQSTAGGDDGARDFAEKLSIALTWKRIKSFIIAIDSFAIPLIVMWIGGMFVFLSADVEALILNSVAVAFVTQVDELMWSSASSTIYVQLEEFQVWPFHDEPKGFKPGKTAMTKAASIVAGLMMTPPIIPMMLTAGIWAVGSVHMGSWHQFGTYVF